MLRSFFSKSLSCQTSMSTVLASAFRSWRAILKDNVTDDWDGCVQDTLFFGSTLPLTLTWSFQEEKKQRYLHTWVFLGCLKLVTWKTWNIHSESKVLCWRASKEIVYTDICWHDSQFSPQFPSFKPVCSSRRLYDFISCFLELRNTALFQLLIFQIFWSSYQVVSPSKLPSSKELIL